MEEYKFRIQPVKPEPLIKDASKVFLAYLAFGILVCGFLYKMGGSL